MSTTEMVIKRLDEELEELVAQMNIYFRQIKSDWQTLCGEWITKLCMETGTTVTEKKNRTMYAKLLLHMLKQGTIDGPFLGRPPLGPLPSLPSDMLKYFNGGLVSPVQSPKEGKLPDWLISALPNESTANLNSRSNTLRDPVLGHIGPDDRRTSFETDRHDRLNSDGLRLDSDRNRARASMKLSSTDGWPHSMDDFTKFPKSTSPYAQFQESDFRKHDTFSLDTSFLTTFHDDIALPRALKEEMKIRERILEERYRDLMLKQQCRHGDEMQKTLERKNAEITTIVQQHKKKCDEYDLALKQSQMKALHLQQDLLKAEDACNAQLTKFQRMAEEITRTREKEVEKKLRDEFEREKVELERSHMSDLQKNSDDLDEKLTRIRGENDCRRDADLAKIRDLELRLQQLLAELEKNREDCGRLLSANREAENLNKKRGAELQELTSRCSAKDVEIRTLREEHASELKSQKNKSESALEQLHQDYNEKLNQASKTIEGLESELQQLRKDLENMDGQRLHELKAKENENRLIIQHMENEYQLKIKFLQQQLQDQEQEATEEIRKLKQLLKDSEQEHDRRVEEFAENARQMQKNFEDLEMNSKNICQDQELQIKKKESQLRDAKKKWQKQEEELRRQVDEARRQSQQEAAELSMRVEQEKSRLLQDFRLQKEQMRGDAEAELMRLRQAHQKEMNEAEARLRETADAYAKTISAKDDKLRQMYEEIVQLGIARDDERQKLEYEQSLKISQVQSVLEAETKELRKKHSLETEKLLDKSNRRLKDLESECNGKITKSNQIIEELRATADQLKEELTRQKADYENQLTQVSDRFEIEQKRFVQQQLSHVTELKKEIDELRTTLKQMDRQLTQQQLDEEEKITRIRSNYEEKLKGRLPVSVQKELEDTIASLKSQIASQRQILNLHGEMGFSSRPTPTRTSNGPVPANSNASMAPAKSNF